MPHPAVTGQPSICFVIPYFGRWPFWMPFFLASCRENPDIHWLLFSDCGTPQVPVPSNVTIRSVSYADYCGLVSSRLAIPFAPEAAYKLCDLKPALGYVHENDLQGYDFWAFGDIDLVYGQLRQYYTAERLSRFDLYATHERRVSGHFCLIRNTQKMRETFMQVPRWQQLLSDQTHHAFDEGPFSRLFIRHKNFPHWLFRAAGQLNPRRRHSEFEETYSTPYAKPLWVDGSRNYPAQWFWRHGVLISDNTAERRFPYFHFMVWKNREWKQIPPQPPEHWQQIAATGAWSVSPQGFAALISQ